MLLRRLLLLCLGCVVATSASAVDLYDLTDLGQIFTKSSQELQSLKLDINNNGVVVGWSHTSSNPFSPIKAFIWDSNNGRQTVNLDMQRSDAALSINNVGQVTGWIAVSGKHQATLWTPNGTLWDETPLNIASSVSSEAVAVDNSGNLGGNYVDLNGISHGFLWTVNPFQPHVMNAELIDINVATMDSGMVAGDRSNNLNQNAVLVRGINDMVAMGSLDSGNLFSTASGMNVSQVVGGGFTEQIPCTRSCFPVAHGFVWDEINGIQDLLFNDALSSWANDINANGKIVGWRSNLPTSIAVLWDSNIPLDLNALTPNRGSWSLERAQAINDSGQIVGIGMVSGELHAFVLTPNGQTATSSDLAIALASSPQQKISLRAGGIETISLEITNHGPDDASAVVLQADIPQGLNIENIQLSKGECVFNTQLHCSVDALTVDEKIDVNVEFSASNSANFNLVFSVESANLDGGVFDNQRLKTTLSLTLAEPTQTDEANSSGHQNDEQTQSTGAESHHTGFSSINIIFELMVAMLIIVRRKFD